MKNKERKKSGGIRIEGLLFDLDEAEKLTKQDFQFVREHDIDIVTERLSDREAIRWANFRARTEEQ